MKADRQDTRPERYEFDEGTKAIELEFDRDIEIPSRKCWSSSVAELLRQSLRPWRCGFVATSDPPGFRTSPMEEWFSQTLPPNKKPPARGGFLKLRRDGQIRTDDILLPKQALYQAELRPEWLGAGN